MDGVKRVLTVLQWIVVSGKWPVVGTGWERWAGVELGTGRRRARTVV